jgi:hypothetical protein
VILIQKDSTEPKKRWLSSTSINAYLKCPRKFYYSNIAKLKQKPSIHLIRGIAVHSAIEKFYQYKLNRSANMDYSELRRLVIDLLRDEWLAQKNSILELQLNRDEVKFYFHDSRKMILNFLHDFLKENGFEKPAPIIEQTLFSKKHRVFGRIDAIYQNKDPPLLVDFKTCKSKELIDDYKRQLAIYTLLYAENYNKHPLTAIHFLKFQEGLTKYRITDQCLQKTRSLVADIHQKIQTNDIKDYPCVCGWCEDNFEVKT